MAAGAHLIQPASLTVDQVEAIEKASARFVFQAISDFATEAMYIFANSPDDQTEVAEDITRECLGKYPGFPLPERIFGVMDFKRAGYIFLPDFAARQALLVDSKAEKNRNLARLQVSQTTLPIRQIRSGVEVDETGTLGMTMRLHSHDYLVTTLFLHYHYADVASGHRKLLHITLATLPSGKLEATYVPSATDTIFIVGANAPSRGESFRTRLSFSRLQKKCRWRVQHLNISHSDGADRIVAEWLE
jgi:hypothetical protein